ncbi:putative signal peptide protein [Paraburkholderia tropica]|uniref:hypothetical protein n=1 Tax=Paraburkholderia TaxID=1822464 RepID=UPI001CB1FD95|nr:MULTISPECIES: hypothetical protein [Paraburkholderia]CAG9210305.1 putative signal peptide protein [Paraburkholderia tropica]
MKNTRILLAALVLGLVSSASFADVHEVKEDIKHDTKSAAKATGHAAKDFGHATASAAKSVGHGIAHGSREGWDATKRVTHEGWDATKRTTKRVFHKDDAAGDDA